MSDVTLLLERWSEGDSSAFNELVPLVYGDLKQLARHYLAQEREGHTLQSTALVNEAYLRLVGQNRTEWNGRAHFFGAAAQVMRRILVDHARRRKSAKRGLGVELESLDPELPVILDVNLDVLELDEALEELKNLDPGAVRLIELRYFGGLSIQDTAAVLGVSTATLNRDWAMARAWLYRRLIGNEV
jgi:RNA polymerase sigma factor (TIGR02999 family)